MADIPLENELSSIKDFDAVVLKSAEDMESLDRALVRVRDRLDLLVGRFGAVGDKSLYVGDRLQDMGDKALKMSPILDQFGNVLERVSNDTEETTQKSTKGLSDLSREILAGKQNIGVLTSEAGLAAMGLKGMAGPISLAISIITTFINVFDKLEKELYPTFRTLVERGAQANVELTGKMMVDMGVEMISHGKNYRMKTEEALELMKGVIAAKVPGVAEEIAKDMGGFVDMMGTASRGLGLTFDEVGKWVKEGVEHFRTGPKEIMGSLYMVKGASDALGVSHLYYKGWVEKLTDAHRPLVDSFDVVTKAIVPYAKAIQDGTMSLEAASKRMLGLGELGPMELFKILAPIKESLPREIQEAMVNPFEAFKKFHEMRDKMPELTEQIRETWIKMMSTTFDASDATAKGLLKSIPELSVLMSGSWEEFGREINAKATKATIDFTKATKDAEAGAKKVSEQFKQVAMSVKEFGKALVEETKMRTAAPLLAPKSLEELNRATEEYRSMLVEDSHLKGKNDVMPKLAWTPSTGESTLNLNIKLNGETITNSAIDKLLSSGEVEIVADKVFDKKLKEQSVIQ